MTAPVFAQGEFFDDYGGGVSQLATTTYNAGFFGGYEDITHQPHTIYISRYPPGREATVNYGVIDLQFRDDSPHGVLIRTYYSSTSVTVTLYGDTEGRTVRRRTTPSRIRLRSPTRCSSARRRRRSIRTTCARRWRPASANRSRPATRASTSRSTA